MNINSMRLPGTKESLENLSVKLLEKSIVLKLRMGAYDEAIEECKSAIDKFGRKETMSDIQVNGVGMLLSNMAIAIAAKYEVEEDFDKKEQYRFQAKKCLDEGIRVWKKLGDDYNLFVVRLHKADFEFDCDGDCAAWFKKYRSIARKIKNDGGRLFQMLYAEVLMQMVDKYCSTGVFENCGISYSVASKYLDEVGRIYSIYCSDDVLKRLELEKNSQTLELTYASTVGELKKFIVRSEKLLNKYAEQVAQDVDANLLDLYVGDIRNNIGTAYYRLGCAYLVKDKVADAVNAYNRAVGYYTECIRAYRTKNEQGSDLLFRVYLNQANVMLCLYRCNSDDNYLNDCIALMLDAIDKFKKLFDNSILIAEAYCTIGAAYRLKRQWKSSLKYYRIAEKLVERNGYGNSAEVLFWIYGGYANIYKNTGEIAKAVEYLKKKRELLLSYGYATNSEEISDIDRELKGLE